MPVEREPVLLDGAVIGYVELAGSGIYKWRSRDADGEKTPHHCRHTTRQRAVSWVTEVHRCRLAGEDPDYSRWIWAEREQELRPDPHAAGLV